MQSFFEHVAEMLEDERTYALRKCNDWVGVCVCASMLVLYGYGFQVSIKCYISI